MVPTFTPAQLAKIAQLLADSGRANILLTLMDGRSLTAGELASIAGVTPQTMSSHLAKLVNCELLAIEKRGRQHFYRLASPLVESMLEGIMLVAAVRARQP
jgi:DNA-binding transcriptional ArsR family regulator